MRPLIGRLTLTATLCAGMITGAVAESGAGPAPTSVIKVTATAASSSSATISWSPPLYPSTITSYIVARDGVDNQGSGAFSTTVSATTRTYTMTRLVTGTTYHLTVKAVSGSAPGPAVTATVPIAATAALGAPNTFTAARFSVN